MNKFNNIIIVIKIGLLLLLLLAFKHALLARLSDLLIALMRINYEQ